MCMCMYPMTCAVYVRNTPSREGPCLEEQALSYVYMCAHTAPTGPRAAPAGTATTNDQRGNGLRAARRVTVTAYWPLLCHVCVRLSGARRAPRRRGRRTLFTGAYMNVL